MLGLQGESQMLTRKFKTTASILFYSPILSSKITLSTNNLTLHCKVAMVTKKEFLVVTATMYMSAVYEFVIAQESLRAVGGHWLLVSPPDGVTGVSSLNSGFFTSISPVYIQNIRENGIW